MRKKALIAAGPSLLLAGSFLLLSHSSITDLGLVLLSAGGLMTLWYKLGVLEERVGSLCAYYEELKEKFTKLEEEKGAKKWSKKG